jgi:O-antigen/teichoic acid export membrane protein
LSLTSEQARQKKPARPRLLRRVLGYALARGTTEAMLGIRGVLLAALLGPAAFGTWALLRILMRYSALAGVSVYRGLELELLRPGSSKERTSDSPAPTALGFVLLIASTIAGLSIAGSLVTADPSTRLLLRGFAAASLAEALYGYGLVCTRVRGNLRLYSILESGTSVLHVIFAVGLASVWGLAGAFAGLTLANLVGIAAASRWLEVRPALHWKPLSRLLHVGLPVVFTLSVGILLSTADRWLVAFWGGQTMLGYYAFAGSLTTAAGALALVVRTVVFPQVYGDVAHAGSAAALQGHLERALLPYARLLPPLLGAASIILGPAVAIAMPQYVEAIAPARLFLLAGAAMGLINLASVGAVAAGRQRKLPLYAVSALALTLGLSAIVLSTRPTLGGVAAATFAGHVLFAALVLRLNVREAGIPHSGRFVWRTLVPLIWCTGAVVLSGFLFPRSDAPSAALSFLVYLLLLLPLVPAWREEWRRLRH